MYQSKFLSHLRCNTTATGITTLLDLIRIIRIICICILLSAAEPADTGVSSLCCSATTAPAILGCLHPPWKEDLIFRQCQTRLLRQHQNPTNGRCCCCSSLWLAGVADACCSTVLRTTFHFSTHSVSVQQILLFFCRIARKKLKKTENACCKQKNRLSMSERMASRSRTTTSRT